MFSFFGSSDRRKKKRVKRECLGCGITFKVLPKETTRFCTPACRDDHVGGPPSKRIERMTDRTSESGCWLWMGTVNKGGYGVMSVDGKTKLVHRLSWKLSGRTLTPGLMLCHKCNTARCCNPDHLYEGTHEDNMRDLREANRGSGSKTSWTQRHEIAVRVMLGEPAASVAEEFGLTVRTVKRWVEELRPKFD